MNVLGIIAEYNPFHFGHAYQIETLKKETNADYVIIAMSGNFVQRGAPALLDKYTRARMALTCGADLIFELPVLYSTASAPYFAMGGISLLQNTGVVTHLGFGTEHDNLTLLQRISDTLMQNPPEFQNRLQQELKNGLSFPAARAKALEAVFCNSKCDNLSQIRDVLASPNNILAIEYLNALSLFDSSMIPCPLLRKGQGYHDTALSEGFCSASAIRKHLKDGKAAIDNRSMPEAALQLLMDYPHAFLFEDDFSQLLHYKLLTESAKTLACYADSSPELANRMLRARDSFVSWTQFCQLLKAKNTTYTRISRLLLHLILNITSDDYKILERKSPVPYLRVLGFRKSAASLLSSVKKSAGVPLITSAADAHHSLPPEALSLLQMDIRASDIYQLALNAKGSRHLLNDYRHPIVTI